MQVEFGSKLISLLREFVLEKEYELGDHIGTHWRRTELYS